MAPPFSDVLAVARLRMSWALLSARTALQSTVDGTRGGTWQTAQGAGSGSVGASDRLKDADGRHLAFDLRWSLRLVRGRT